MADLEARINAYCFVRTICSYECAACRYACLRKLTDRQANGDWPMLLSSTHADDVHAPRPCAHQGCAPLKAK